MTFYKSLSEPADTCIRVPSLMTAGQSLQPRIGDIPYQSQVSSCTTVSCVYLDEVMCKRCRAEINHTHLKVYRLVSLELSIVLIMSDYSSWSSLSSAKVAFHVYIFTIWSDRVWLNMRLSKRKKHSRRRVVVVLAHFIEAALWLFDASMWTRVMAVKATSLECLEGDS